MRLPWGRDDLNSIGTLENLIEDRLQQLDASARELLPWAAALGRSFEPSTVAYIADYPITRLLTAIEQLEQQAMIRPSTTQEGKRGYDFAHDILRQVVYKQLSQPRRELVHHQIAKKLYNQAAQDETKAGTIFHHADLAGDHTLATSMAILATGHSLKLFAYAEALELAQKGIHHCQFLEIEAQSLSHARLLKLCAFAGVSGAWAKNLENEAEHLIQQAKALGFTEVETDALETLMVLKFHQGKFSEIHQHTRRVAEISQIVDSATTVRLLANSGDCLVSIGREIGRAEALLLEAQTLAERVGVESCDLESGLGNVHRHYGRYGPARTHLQRAWQLARAKQNHWQECYCLTDLAMTALEAGDSQGALPYCDEILEVATQIQEEGSDAAIATALAALAHYQLDDVLYETEIVDAIETLRQVDAKRMLAYVLTGAAEIDLRHSRPQSAIQRAEEALAHAVTVDHPSAVALSGASLIQGLLASGEQQQAEIQWDDLHKTDYHSLSANAQAAINQAHKALQNHQNQVLNNRNEVVMSLVIVETLSDTPLTPEDLTDNDIQFLNCLEERQGTWRYSLLSSDRQRMLCNFEVPDVESLRESYRRSGVPYSHLWSGEILKPEGATPERGEATFKVFEGTYPEGLTPAQCDEMNQAMLPAYAEHRVEWIQSFVSMDRTRVICELNAPDLESVDKAHQKIGFAKSRLWPATILAEV